MTSGTRRFRRLRTARSATGVAARFADVCTARGTCFETGRKGKVCRSSPWRAVSFRFGRWRTTLTRAAFTSASNYGCWATASCRTNSCFGATSWSGTTSWRTRGTGCRRRSRKTRCFWSREGSRARAITGETAFGGRTCRFAVRQTFGTTALRFWEKSAGVWAGAKAGCGGRTGSRWQSRLCRPTRQTARATRGLCAFGEPASSWQRGWLTGRRVGGSLLTGG